MQRNNSYDSSVYVESLVDFPGEIHPVTCHRINSEYNNPHKTAGENMSEGLIVGLDGEPLTSEELEEREKIQLLDEEQLNTNDIKKPLELLKKKRDEATKRLRFLITKPMLTKREQRESLVQLTVLTDCVSVALSLLAQDFTEMASRHGTESFILAQQIGCLIELLIEKKVISEEEVTAAWTETRKEIEKKLNDHEKVTADTGEGESLDPKLVPDEQDDTKQDEKQE